jgi:tripartite-type tricarboxylate transporter receptor subunit TctC
MTTRRQFNQAALGLGIASSLSAFNTHAQAIEQVKIYYGFPAGSAGDITARRVGEKMAGSSYTKNAAIVDNKPGAGARISMDLLKAAPADGSILTMAPYSVVSVYPHIYAKLSYDPFKDFVCVSTSTVMQHGFAVGPLVPASVKTLKDYITWAKANPKEASYASPAAGSTPHFLGALLGMNAGITMTHVPYRGSAPGVADLVAGQIGAMSNPVGDYLQHYKAGRIRILATSGKTRSPFVPEVPTFTESGFPDLAFEEWFGFFAPAKTPTAIVNAASLAINNALKDKSVIESLNGLGLITRGCTPEEMTASQKAEYDRWGPWVKRIGFTAES